MGRARRDGLTVDRIAEGEALHVAPFRRISPSPGCPTAMTMEIEATAKTRGRSSVQKLAVEDLPILSFEASTFTGGTVAGLDRAFDG